MKYLLFDTNIYLALIFPLDIWKSIVEETLDEVLQLIKKNKVEVVCPELVFTEIHEKINWLTNEFNRDLLMIYNEFKGLQKSVFTKKNLLYFRKIMEHIIFTEKELSKKNRFYFIEGIILNEIKQTPKTSIGVILENCLEFFNEINVRLVGEFANYIKKFHISLLEFPPIKEKKSNFIEVFEKVKKSIKPKNDAKIISIFIHFLRERKSEGIFITHDFHHLLLNSIALEAIFPEIKILRPGYVKCFIK